MFRTLMTSVALVAVVAAAAAAAADEVTTSGTNPHVVAAIAAKPKAPADARETPSAEARTSKVAQSGKHPQSKDSQVASEQTGKDDSQPAGDVKMSGMSILGNEDAPKSLVIVPWKSARIGKMQGMSMMLDDSVQPVDKDVFMRELAYYHIRAGAQ
jgi:hypothetical protein